MTKFKALVLAMLAAGSVGGASVASAATTLNSNMTVDATLASACEVAMSGTISFNTVTALESTGDQSASNSSGFAVACSSDLSPTIYSTTARAMSHGTDSLPFTLCLGTSCTGSNEVSTAQLGANSLGITQDGSMQTVPLTAKILAADFKALPSGAYTKTVVISVDY